MTESKPLKGDNGRNGAVDFLKAFAIVGVLFIHACSAGFWKPDSFSDISQLPSLDWMACLVLGTLSRASVSIFLMCTGVLMLDPERNADLKKIWTRHIPRLLAALWFWRFLYHVRNAVAKDGVSTGSHLYYINIALLVYALLPALRAITARADRNTLRYLLILWAIFGLIYPKFQKEWPLNTLSGIPAQYGLNLAYTCVGYTLLGWYVQQSAKTPWKWAVIGAAGYIYTFLATLFPSMQAKCLISSAFNVSHPGVALASAGVCGWVFARSRRSPARSVPAWITELSKASFCIYLCHLLFLTWFQALGLSALTGPCILYIPLTVGAVLAASLAVYFVLKRIPVANRWLM